MNLKQEGLLPGSCFHLFQPAKIAFTLVSLKWANIKTSRLLKPLCRTRPLLMSLLFLLNGMFSRYRKNCSLSSFRFCSDINSRDRPSLLYLFCIIWQPLLLCGKLKIKNLLPLSHWQHFKTFNINVASGYFIE